MLSLFLAMSKMSEHGVIQGQEGPYEVCIVCGYNFPKANMRRYKNKWYCVKLGCYHDIADMIKKGD